MIEARFVGLAIALLAAAGCMSSGSGSSLAPSEESEAVKAAVLNKQLGTVYLRQGNLALAKEKLERAEKYNPKDAETHSVLALLYEKLDIPKEVDAHYKTAIRLAPKNPQIVNNYAVFLCRNGRTDEGVKRFLESAKNPLYRTPELAYTNAGVCLRSAKQYEDAGNAFARAVQIRPSFAEAVYQSADLEMERGQLAESRARIDKFVASYEATPELLLLGVRLNQTLGDRMGEEKYTRRLRVEFPDSPQFRSLSENKRNPG